MGGRRALRSLHLVAGGPPGGPPGGRMRQALALAGGLAAKGHRPAVGAPGAAALAGGAPEGVDLLELPARAPGRWRALRRAVTSGGFEIVHLHEAGLLRGLRWICAGAPMPPLVLSVGGDIGYGRGPSRGIGRVRGVARFVAVSEWVWSALVRAGIEEDRIAVIHTAIDLKRFGVEPGERRRLREAGRHALGLAESDFVVGALSGAAGRDGIDHLIEATRRLEEDRAIRLVVAGRRRPEGEAFYAGWRDDMPEFLAALDLYVHPAVGGNGFPVTLREAMAIEVPVVATDLMGIREILDNGKQGLIVPAADPAALALNIQRLRRDPAHARELAHAGSLKVQRYGIQAMVDRTEDLYFRLLK